MQNNGGESAKDECCKADYAMAKELGMKRIDAVKKAYHSPMWGLNQVLLSVAGEYFNPVYVIEYPKCGATWVSRILRAYLEVPREAGLSKPVCRRAVIQLHEMPAKRIRKAIIVVRDPRDVWVSRYFHQIHLSPDRSIMEAAGILSGEDDRDGFRKYVQYMLIHEKKHKPYFSYHEFIKRWSEHPGAFFLSYEKMHQDAVAGILGALEFMNIHVDRDKLNRAVESQRFEKITGRAQGETDASSHKRKGIVGDWRNYFDADLLELIQREQADLLDRLGYQRESLAKA